MTPSLPEASGATAAAAPPESDRAVPGSTQRPDSRQLGPVDLDPVELDPAERQALSGVHLVVCGHGTRSALGQRTMAALVDAIRSLAPGPVHAASVDVQEPSADAVVGALPPDRPGVIQPLLLSTGYHTRVDLQNAARRHPGLRRGHGMVVARALGPDPVLAALQVRRLREAGWSPEVEPGAVVMGAAGSSVTAGRRAAARQRDLLADALGLPVHLGYGAGRPSIAEVVRAAGSEADALACSSYLLTPGTFQDRLAAAGPQRLAGPLVEAEDEAGLRAVALLALRRAAAAAGGGEVEVETQST